VLTQANPTSDFLRRQSALADASEQPHRRERNTSPRSRSTTSGWERFACRARSTGTDAADEAKLASLAQKLGIEPKQLTAAVQFLFLMANAIARLCYQEFQLRQRINELTAVYNVAMMLAGARDLRWVLQRTVQVVCELMDTKAPRHAADRPERDELVIKAVYNLARISQQGPGPLSTAEIDQIALSPKGVEYVRNMATDPRVLYPQESVREGIVSMLSVGMRYKGKPIGVLRVYTAQEQAFPR
jgi:hypothetical protein